MAEPNYLLDANICICLLEGLSEQALARVEQCEPGEIVASSIVYVEVMREVTPSSNLALGQVPAFFDIVTVEPFDRSATAYASIPSSRGRFDRLVGAHALALGLTVVTNNERDFTDIPRLSIENWTR